MQRRPARVGLLVLRHPTQPTPCWECPKIPNDAPLKSRLYAVEMTHQMIQTYQFYRECFAVGQFPDDPIVRRFASLIRQMEDGYNRNAVAGRLETLITLTSIVRGGGKGKR